MVNILRFTDRRTIEQEAREWLIRLDGDEHPDPERIASLREWMSRSPAHRDEFLRISSFWKDADILTGLSVPVCTKSAGDEQPARPSTHARPGGRFGGIGRAAAVAACLVMVSTVLVSIHLISRPAGTTGNGVFVTSVGDSREFTLSDGSVVELNTDTRLEVRYEDDARVVRLLQGEAHFEVMHDPERPFEVHAGQGVLTAVGTAFSVYLTRVDVKVTVTEGLVELAALKSAHPGQAASRGPGDSRRSPASDVSSMERTRLSYLGHGQIAKLVHSRRLTDDPADADPGELLLQQVETLTDEELFRRMSWREGYLIFAGEPLSAVVEEINRYVSVDIEIGDPSLNDVKVGGRFRVGDLQAVLSALESGFGIEVNRMDGGQIQLLPGHS